MQFDILIVHKVDTNLGKSSSKGCHGANDNIINLLQADLVALNSKLKSHVN